VEPYALLARALRIGLEEEGFSVDLVDNGENANEKVRESAYDVILLDLPSAQSRDALRCWRSGGCATPVLVVTEPARESEWRVEIPQNSYATLNKPFALEDLIGHLRTLTANRRKHEKNGSL
jgi:DNA-binding response OmpR family regulator